MELKLYLQILLKKWWVIIPTFLVTFVATVALTFTQIEIYKATATLLVSPSDVISDIRTDISNLNLLSREEAIAGTYAEIAMSRTVKKDAATEFGVLPRDYFVDSRLLAGTNVLEITVEGPNPEVVRNLTNVIGQSTIESGKRLYRTFTLSFLDEAVIPSNPIRPLKTRNLLLGAVFGLILGGGLAFLVEYLTAAPIPSSVTVNIIDSQTGAYNEKYFMQRLGEEMVRARRNRYPLSLSLVKIDNLTLWDEENSSEVRADVLRQVALLVNDYLREEDVVAYFKNDTFSCLLPDTTGENAKALMEYIQTRIAWTPFQSHLTGMKFSLKSLIGIVMYNHNGVSRDELVTTARRALELAEVSEDGKAYLVAEDFENNTSQDNHPELEPSAWQM